MKLVSCTALGLALLFSTAAHTETAQFGPATQIGRVTGLPPLEGDLNRLYRAFRQEAKYFAAMAVNFDTGYGFYLQNFHDAGRARAAALEGCRIGSGADGCVIYAVAMPETLPVDQSAARGLSQVAYDDFTTVYREQQKPGTYAAFAISGASHHGYGYGYETEADARDTALAYCDRSVAADMAEIGPEGRQFSRARGWNSCRIVDVTFTPAGTD